MCSTRCCFAPNFLDRFEHDGDTLSSSDAGGSERVLHTTLLHGVHQVGGDACTCSNIL